MSIKTTDRKMLWGRSGGKCALCKIQLLETTSLGHSSILGEEAHIVAREEDGPRGTSPLTAKQRDAYSNLVLLCPTDHSRIDKIPAGVDEFPVDRLIDIKRRHESEILASGELDKDSQFQVEQWSMLIDQLDERAGWERWMHLTAPIFQGGGPFMTVSFYDRLQDLSRWIYTRVWPSGRSELRGAIESMNEVVLSFLQVFDEHSESRSDALLETVRFYKIREWNAERYRELLQEYKDHVALVQDLMLEITRYGNYVANLVRRDLDPMFRFEEGLLTVRPDDLITWTLLRPSFREHEVADAQPFKSLEDFKRIRTERDIYTKRA